MGHSQTRRRGKGPLYLVSDLGEFDWYDGQMRLIRIHEDVTVEDVRKKTGFELAVASDCQITPPPSSEELRLLREIIDPLGVRKLETLGGSARRDLLRGILEREGAYEPG